jgi:hypothetical protein
MGEHDFCRLGIVRVLRLAFDAVAGGVTRPPAVGAGVFFTNP